MANAMNSSEGQFVGWHPPVQQRGTLQLLISCILTLVLCVWTALHLNVPKYGATTWQKFRRKFFWMLVGIFAPELVVYVAYVQREGAAWMTATMRGLKGPGADPKWSMGQSFFIVMGGLACRTTNDPNLVFTPSSSPPVLTLNAHAAKDLAMTNLLPDIPKSQVEDKSKADSFAKSLVCLQAFWLVLQLLARLGNHLPITLLEVNTFGHVCCALIIYALWWNKPLDVNTPILLPCDQQTNSLLAYLWMRSEISSDHEEYPEKKPSEISCLNFHPLCADGSRSTRPITSYLSLERREAWPFERGDESQPAFSHRAGCEVWDKNAFRRFEKSGYKDRSGVKPHIPREDASRPNRWRLAANALDNFILPATGGDTNLLPHSWAELEERAADWPGIEGPPYHNRTRVRAVLALASAAYGGLHAAAWVSHFPTAVEKWFWIGSALTIAASGILTFVYFGLKDFSFYAGWYHFRGHLIHLGDRLQYALVGFGAFYVVARLFIVVEAFISLRSVPISVYTTPAWAQLIPHF